MGTIFKTGQGHWRAQVRRNGKYASKTFRLKTLADRWVIETERSIDLGCMLVRGSIQSLHTLSDLIDLHIADMHEVDRPLRRSKHAVLAALKRDLGSLPIGKLNRESLIEFGKQRTRQGAGPVTLAIDFSYLGTVLTHAAAVHGLIVDTESVRLARIALARLGLIGRSAERDRRPTKEEIDALLKHFDEKPGMLIPMSRIIKFAIATALRQEEICNLEWQDVDGEKRLVVVRNRKDPRRKQGNHQRVPLLNLTQYDAWQLLCEQKAANDNLRCFPYNHRSVGAAFHRACRRLGIENLKFHDLRHEATSRLFEAGLTIEQVSLVTGHRDWKMLRRYTNLRPEDLLQKEKDKQASQLTSV
jgi:integrase